jgi:hypothetical protein
MLQALLHDLATLGQYSFADLYDLAVMLALWTKWLLCALLTRDRCLC